MLLKAIEYVFRKKQSILRNYPQHRWVMSIGTNFKCLVDNVIEACKKHVNTYGSSLCLFQAGQTADIHV